MDTIGDYEAWKAKRQQNGVGAASVVLGSVEDQPDQLAGDLNLATEFGKVTGNPVPPAPMVKEYRSVFQSAIDKTRAETILSSSPRLTEWLRNQENAALAKDDLEGLSWWETALGATENSLKRAGMSVPQTYDQFMANKFAGDAADLKRGFGDILWDEREPIFKDGKEVDRLWAAPEDVLGAAWRWGTSRWSGLMADMGLMADPVDEAAVFQMRADEWRRKIADMPMSPGAQVVREKMGTIKGTLLEQFQQFGQVVAEDPAGFLSFVGQVGAESLPALGVSTAVGVATRNPTAAAATLGSLSGAREYGSSAGDIIAQSGYDLTTPEGALAAISDEAMMRRAAEAGQTRALIIGALDGLSGGIAGKVLSENPVGNMLLQSMTQALFGSGGEAAAQLASGQEFKLADVLLEGIAEFATAPVEVGGMALTKAREMRGKAKDAEARKTLFAELSGQAVNSKLRARMPDRFRQFVDKATANGPVENVFVPADQFQQYFQSVGIDPMALADELDGVTRDDLDAALAAGGDLRIPTATYAAKIAGSEHDAFLMENMRFDPTDMTAREAADFNARVDDIMQDMWAEAEDIRQDEERWLAVEEKIHDQVVSQMRAAGLSTERAMAEVQPIVAFYRTRAARMGLTTEEYLARHPLPGIQGAIPQGMQFKNVDELNRTLAEARNRRAPVQDKRQSLLEFIDSYGGISDRGGELKARDADVIKRGKGKKTLNLLRDTGNAGQGSMFGPSQGGKRFGVDDVAQAAIEAGFMADNSVVIEYKAAVREGREVPDITAALWDAIDAELRDDKQFSEQDAAPVDDAYLDDIEAYLNRLGLDLNNSDDEIRAAIEKDQAAPDRMYGQSGGILTDSAAFKAWFGASKVVDADGKPLVVYHGTNQQIEEFDLKRGGASTGENAGATKAFFFTDSRDVAGQYAERAGKRVVANVAAYEKESERLQKEVARLEKAANRTGDWDAYERAMETWEAHEADALNADDAEGQNAVEVYLSIQNPMVVEFDGGRLSADRDLDQLIDDAKANGHDGLILRNLEDSPQMGVVSDQFVAFAPTQIKSVNNRGTWDANDPRILYQSASDTIRSALRSLLDFVRRGPGNKTRTVEIGQLDDARAKAIKEASGIDISGYTHTVDAFAIRHVLKEHGDAASEKSRGQIAVTDSDVLAIPEIIGNATHVVTGIKGRRDQDLIGWIAPMADGSVAYVEEVRTGKKRLATLSMRKFPPATKSESIASSLSPNARNAPGVAVTAIPQTISGPKTLESWGGDTATDLNVADTGAGFKPNGHLFQGNSDPRGLIQIGGDGKSMIRLFETANLSTLQHEAGHLFLTMLQRDAAYGDAGSVAELETVKSWNRENAAAVAADGNKAMPDAKITAEDVRRAIDTGSTGDIIKDAAIDVGMQEQFARGYEAYLMEGKAPSTELQSVFAKMRAWMISVYKTLRGLNVEMSDDIRGVFDRMLATDEEIAKAQRATGDGGAVFATAEQMGLTPDEFDRFTKLRVQAEDEAKARLQREIMEPIKRQKEDWFKVEKAKAEAEVTRQVNAMPVFRALEWLGNRRWLGEDQPEAMTDMRMSKDILVDRYGEGVLKTLPRGMQTVYSVEGGMDPDNVAGWFGFDSGDQMIRAMERAPKRADAIKDETARVMNERHGDALNDGEIEKIALDAVHTDRKGEWIAAELKAVAEVAGVDVKLTMKDARASARQTVARMKVRDATAAMRYLAAERKAAEEASRLGAILAREGVWMQNARRRIATKARAAMRDAGTADAVAGQVEQANKSTGNYNETVQKLIDAKRRQLMNHALFMEARAVADEVTSAERFVQRLNKASMREKIAGAGRRENAQMDYLGAIDDIVDRYDFRKLSARAEQRRGALLAFVDAMKAAGRENQLAIPEAVLRDAERKPYKTLTVEELRGVVDSLKNLQHIALRWNELIDAQNQRKLDEAVAEIANAFDQNLPKRPPGRVKTTGEGVRNAARQFLDLVLNATTILREIDGFKDMGAAYRHLKAPIDQAMDRLTIRKEKAAADMEALYAVYSKEDRRRMAVREYIPALGYSLSKWERIAVALNTGNEGNYQRLTDPKVRGSLTEPQVKAALAGLDERDADFIQSVWDYVGSFRDDIAAREKRATGVEPQWVEAAPVQVAGKTLKGGYYPLKYDPRLSSLARDDETQSIAESLQAGRFGKAQTKRGHLEARAKSSGRDVELDMSVLHRHVNQVIYDLELSEAVANSWKVLQSGQVRGAFMDAGRQADFDALEVWLKDVAEGQLAAGDWMNRNARRFKSNFTAAKLAFNLGTVAAQVTGLSQTMVVVGKRDFVRGLQASFRLGIADEIAAKSPFMASRRTTFNKDIADYYNDPALGPTASRWGDIKRDWIGPASFWLMTKVQWLLVDIPTWMAGYHQGLRMYGNDEAKAVAHADGIVKRAQASGLFSDRSAIERGSVSRTTRQNDVVRLFTTLGSYMFAKFNVAYERAATGSRVIRKEGVSLRSAQEVASMTLDMAFLFTLEAVVMAALKGRLPDDEDGEDEGWAAFLAKETAFSVLGTIPFVRDMASVGRGFEGGGAYGGITAEIAKPFQEVSQGEIDKGLVKSVISGTGLFLGLPATQINRVVDAGWRQAEGKDVSPLEYLLGKTGK